MSADSHLHVVFVFDDELRLAGELLQQVRKLTKDAPKKQVQELLRTTLNACFIALNGVNKEADVIAVGCKRDILRSVVMPDFDEKKP